MIKKLKIALGDLRHNTTGRHSIFMPIGIGYITSYLLSNVDKEKVEIRIYDDPNTILKDINDWYPDIIGLSNYCWNTELSKLVFKYAKMINPKTICVSGGPEFPFQPEKYKEYLSKHEYIDFYVYREGEIAFTELVKKILENKENDLKNKFHDGIVFINQKTKELILGEPITRLKDLDIIPSPYLNGLMDQWFNGYYAPCIETTRGCPFSCNYCSAGHTWFSGMSMFSVERVNAELTYMAKHMKDYPSIVLGIWDTNFGMYEKDEKIAKHLQKLQIEYGWPNTFTVTTGKANYDRILDIASMLDNKMFISCSVQSLHPATLNVIKRANLPLEKYIELQKEIKKRGMPSDAELILPLPEETKESFFKGLKILFKVGIESITPYTTMLLRGAYLASPECREKYDMQTKFRLLPRQFGEYEGNKCFEIEEICISTNTMSFEDYLDCRGFSLIATFLSSEQFDIIRKHVKELDLDFYDYIYYMWNLIKLNKTMLSEIYHSYINETKEELWDSKEKFYNYFSKQDNYNKLLSGQLGDNLMRKYKTKMLLERSTKVTELVYNALKFIAKDNLKSEEIESLDSAKKWMTLTRNVSEIFKNNYYQSNNTIIELNYDISSWYNDTQNSSFLTSYKKKVKYKIYCDSNYIKKIFDDGQKLYGNDLTFMVGRLLINWSIKNFWSKYELIK